MDFASAYVQENDLLKELLGDDQDVYKKNYYTTDGYDGEKLKNLYAYDDADDAIDDDADGYGSVDEAESSGDEMLAIPANGYSAAADFEDDTTEDTEPQVGYSYGVHEDTEEEKGYQEPNLPPVQDANNVNLKASVGLSRAVSVPVVRLEEEIKDGFEKKDWNKAFQTILALPESESKYQKLSQLAHEFIFVAETYGKVIISEINVPTEHKTIKPISIGGQAGGEKYIAQGILFKFALDVGNLYGGNDEYAQKAAGHDLKGLINYSLAGIPGLHFPLMSLIHYMGYCLIAMSLLPIGKDSLKYGSADAGKTMHFDIPAINEKMKAAGEALRLKGHIAGFSKYQTNLCYGPGDIECHLGKDGRYYVLDFARTFPPEAILPGATPQKGQILFKLLRPELVKSNAVPLSSDAFTGFGMGDPQHKTHNREVAEATQRLFVDVIPKLAERIKVEDYKLGSDGNLRVLSVLDSSLISEIHKEGINIRHIGCLRRQLGETNSASYQILVEMIVRIVKSKLKKQWRAITKVNQHITEEQCKQVTVVMLNNLYSDSEAANKYWTQKIPKYLKKKFRYALFKSEKSRDLRDVLTDRSMVQTLLARFQQITGVVLSANAIADTRGFKEMTFVHSDIERINAVVKNMHIVELADTQLLLWNGIRSTGRESERILSLASKKLEGNNLMSLHLTKILKLVYQLYQKSKKVRSENSTALASKLLNVIIRLQPKTEMAYVLYGKILSTRFDFASSRDEMIKILREGLTQLPNSSLLHTEMLKKRVKLAISARFTDANITELEEHYKMATQESYLKGIASMYFGFALLFESERIQEGLDLITVGASLTPQKVESIMKLAVKRTLHCQTFKELPWESLVALLPLIPKNLYHLFDDVKFIESSKALSDTGLNVAKELFHKLIQLTLSVSENYTTPPVVELIKARVDTLEQLSLAKFQDLPHELVEAFTKCHKLIKLELKETNLTIKDVIEVLEGTKLKSLLIPGINDMTLDSLKTVLSFSSITDLNISKAPLSREEMALVLENANVKRLYLDNIASLDFDLVKAFAGRNREVTCLSLKGTSIKERDLMEYFPKLKHDSLQVLILPHGPKLLFTGAHTWQVSVSVQKMPTLNRIEMRLNCLATPDPEVPVLVLMTVTNMSGQSTATICTSDNNRSVCIMMEQTMAKMLTFLATPEALNERFTIGTIINQMQTTLSFFNEKQTVITQSFQSHPIFGCSLMIPTGGPTVIKVPPKTDLTFLMPIITSFILKKKAAL